MKLQELNQEELNAINGGGLFDSSDSSSNGGILGAIGIGNLLSTESYSKDGDEESWSSTSLGNGINLDLGGLFNSMQS
ncbi:MAG: hypothetical protein V4687_16265 [Bacteroidota bacterium]